MGQAAQVLCGPACCHPIKAGGENGEIDVDVITVDWAMLKTALTTRSRDPEAPRTPHAAANSRDGPDERAVVLGEARRRAFRSARRQAAEVTPVATPTACAATARGQGRRARASEAPEGDPSPGCLPEEDDEVRGARYAERWGSPSCPYLDEDGMEDAVLPRLLGASSTPWQVSQPSGASPDEVRLAAAAALAEWRSPGGSAVRKRRPRSFTKRASGKPHGRDMDAAWPALATRAL